MNLRTILVVAWACAGSLMLPYARAEPPEAPVESVGARIRARGFPSVFQAWSDCTDCSGADPVERMARHDLAWTDSAAFGLQWDGPSRGRATAYAAPSLPAARAARAQLLGLNPSFVLIAEVKWRDAPREWLPPEDPFWQKDAQGKRVAGWAEGGYLKLAYGSPEFREHVARQAEAAVRSGVFDGVLFDWANEAPDALADILRRTRKRIGDGLILVNPNAGFVKALARRANGVFMEVPTNDLPSDQVRDSLVRYQKALKRPVLLCLEGWGPRDDLRRMRAYTTLGLTHTDGYVLYSDPNSLPTPDHQHQWYAFWDAPLGRPVGKRRDLGHDTHRREFENGTVVYNHKAGAVTVRFPEDRRRASTGVVGREFSVGPRDGEIFLREGPLALSRACGLPSAASRRSVRTHSAEYAGALRRVRGGAQDLAAPRTEGTLAILPSHGAE